MHCAVHSKIVQCSTLHCQGSITLLSVIDNPAFPRSSGPDVMIKVISASGSSLLQINPKYKTGSHFTTTVYSDSLTQVSTPVKHVERSNYKQLKGLNSSLDSDPHIGFKIKVIVVTHSDLL